MTLACVILKQKILSPPLQPQHTPHLWQAAVAAAVRQPQLLEGQSSNRQDQSASPVTFCLIPLYPNCLDWFLVLSKFPDYNGRFFIHPIKEQRQSTVLLFVS